MLFNINGATVGTTFIKNQWDKKNKVKLYTLQGHNKSNTILEILFI